MEKRCKEGREKGAWDTKSPRESTTEETQVSWEAKRWTTGRSQTKAHPSQGETRARE